MAWSRSGRRVVSGLLAAAAFFAVTPGALAESGSKPNYVRSLLEMRHEKVVIQRWDLSCGAAALATILAYQHGDPVPERKIAEAMLGRTDPMKVRARQGFSLLDMKRYVESRGYEATGYAELTLQDLIDFGPTIVPVRLNGYNHFVVFRGVLGDRVLLADPAVGNRTLRRGTFEAAWVGQMGFIVERRDGRAPPNQLTAMPSDFRIPGGAVLNNSILD